MTNDSLSATVCVTLTELGQIQNMEVPSYQSLQSQQLMAVVKHMVSLIYSIRRIVPN